uniref:hypothetical protein n=1 Tax=Porodaedalea niemelaei TaxID=175858 RepID=UPI0023AAAD2D|nr:hypothetical protein P1R16_mgp27 [Porodaedalea niemelaei]WCF76665.1 hypothetical protein [Porodaedalea niemelaei]
MDLETRTIEGKMQPYCVSTYYEDGDGIDRARSFYLNDYTTPEAMMKDAVNSLLISKFDGYKVYLHNFSNFDAVFLIRILSELGHKIRPVIRDGRIINIALDYGITKYTKYTIYFRDSYLLLSSSLSTLAKNFNVENKGLFPYSFVNDPNIKLNYLGLIPDIKYFDGITVEQYDEYCKTIQGLWSLEYQTKYYCELDCMVLYKVIKTFSNQIFELFKLDINKYPTLPSLALAIYRSNFLKDNFKVSLIDGTMYIDLKKAYSGGMVDVYKPTNEPDTKVFGWLEYILAKIDLFIILYFVFVTIRIYV